MLFVGDVAIAQGVRFEFKSFANTMREVPWCINLEGAVIGGDCELPSWGVYNASDWRESFRTFELAPPFIGNNHIHDLADGVSRTRLHLEQIGLTAFGAGGDAEQAARPARVHSGEVEYSLLGFGWPVIGCRPANHHQPGVNRLEERRVLALAEGALKQDDGARVVVVIHGNYEFECYPQPAHRQLAMALIDLGIYAVIFHHPHIVGPVERYKGRTIAYSLGNWAFSYGRFFGGKLRFPEISFRQIAVELGEGRDLVHHAGFEPPSTVRYERTEQVDAADFSLRPVFEGFNTDAYLKWFKINRIKRKGLPIYRDATDSPTNWLRNRWVGGRQVLIDFAAKSGLKSMRRGT